MTAILQKTTHLPPQALPIERAVLGAALLEASATAAVLSLLAPQAFYQPGHQLVFLAMQAGPWTCSPSLPTSRAKARWSALVA
jgi:hypothetical protein